MPELAKAVREKKWTAETVARAFCKRAAVAQQLLNCLTEMFFDDAIARARELDRIYEETGEVVGPLHGVPVSIKDHHQYKGTTAALGFTYWSTKFSEENSAMVDLLLDLGAVLYVKTTVPVAMMMPDTDSHLLGPTLNPHNRRHSPGGSSGGEGALIAFGGSPIGVGSDIGGSIRFPAVYNGIIGLKPTAARFPTAGNVSGLRGQHTIKSVVGPLSRSYDSIEYFSRALLQARPERFDPAVNPVGWRDANLAHETNGANGVNGTNGVNGHAPRLVFGYYATDGYVDTTPAVKRAVQMTVDALKRAGHEVVEWEPLKHDVVDGLIDRVFTSDGGRFVAESRGDEPLFPYMRAYGKTAELGAGSLWEIEAKRSAIEKEYFRRWNASGAVTSSGKPLDAIICPVSPVSGHPPHHASYVGYTSVWNAFDYPAVAFPVTTLDKSVDGKPQREPLSKKDAKVWADYDPETYHGGHVGLQVVCRRHEDEKAVAVARIISEALASS